MLCAVVMQYRIFGVILKEWWSSELLMSGREEIFSLEMLGSCCSGGAG